MTTLPVHPGADDVLDALDPEQREVAAHPLGPMCVLAGAGTGKTRAITHRIAYGVLSGAYQPQRVLAVTFTARAAGEMRTRLRDLGVGGVQARTFHAAALRQLHYFWPQAVGGAAPEVMPHKAGAVAEAGGRLRLRLDSPAVRDVAAEIEWSKVSMLTADSYAAAVARERREPPAGLDATAMARVIAAYEEVKTQRGVIDFEDVLLLMAGILGEHDQVARAVRGQYRHFVVDEYQDVNRLQQRLLELWLGERDDVCVVGDPAQTIYSFTGASPQHLLGFRSRHPQARVVELVRNYRSTPQVVGLANLVLRSPGGGRRSGSVELRAQRADGAAPELLVADDDPAEAE
ncbi:MAG: ATP-dependent helicase, partial [Micrococcales bacterium]|nr:ATP-dependent helicase [Micrococcales bacterium]